MSEVDYICDYCSRSFSRKHNLRSHIENCHLTLSCHCHVCDQGFGSPTGLFLHMNRGHNSTGKPYPECDLCGRVFTRRQNVISHLKTVHMQNNSVFTCSICRKTFTTVRNMKRHVSIIHNPDIGYLTCNECQKMFKGKGSLVAHLESCHSLTQGSLKCELCGKVYSKNKNLKRHLEMTHGRRGVFKCEICPKVYTSNQSLRRHSRTQHLSETNVEYSCEYCLKIIHGRDNWESHIAFYHKQHDFDTRDSSKYDYSCEICSMRYKREHLLRRHMKKEHTFQDFYEYCRNSLIKSEQQLEKIKRMKLSCMLYGCEYCVQAFASIYELKDHMHSSHDKDYSLTTCNVCFRKFFSEETINEHRKTCVPPKNVNACSYCDKLFTDVSSLDFHIRIFHPQSQTADSNVSTTSLLEDSVDNQPSYKCARCQRIYYNERSLKHHVRLKHTVNDPVQCDSCPKVCENRYYLAYHMKMAHCDKSLCRCDYCNKQFKSKRNIRRHIEFTHLRRQRHKCIECETLFKEKRSLRKHVRRKHPNSAVFPQCHICWKRFESAKSCKTHLKLLHSFNMNSHPCDLCSVSFDSPEALNIHMSTKHSAEDEIYKCQDCNLVFKGNDQYSMHYEKFHTEQSFTKELPRCIICVKDFSSRKTLRRHIRKFHNEFNVEDLASYGRRMFTVDCVECAKNFNDDFYQGVYLKVKHLRESIVFRCNVCDNAYNSLEYAIQRYKQCNDVTHSKLYMSELCTTQMSGDESRVGSVEPENTPGFKVKEETMEPDTTDDIKMDLFDSADPKIDLFNEIDLHEVYSPMNCIKMEVPSP